MVEQLKQKLVEILEQAGWYTLLRGVLLDDTLDRILLSLWQKRESGHRFLPQSSLWFKPFELCKPEDLKVVVLNDAPWEDLKTVDGLALSAKKSVAGLRPVKTALKKDIVNLEPVAKQGVLLINLCVTRSPLATKEKDHWELWKPFMSYLVDMLLNRDLLFVLIGSIAEAYGDTLEEEAVLIYDSPILYPGRPNEWSGKDFPREINEKLKEMGKEIIEW